MKKSNLLSSFFPHIKTSDIAFIFIAAFVSGPFISLAQDKVIQAPYQETTDIGHELGQIKHEKYDYENDGIYDYERITYFNQNEDLYRTLIKRADTLFSSEDLRYDHNYKVVNRSWYDSRAQEPHRQWDLKYSNDGLLISEYWDGNGDNVYERGYTYDYDERGNRISLNYDKNADGTFDDVTTYTFNEENLLVKEVYTRNFPNGIATTKTYDYDTKGRKIEFSEDRDSDGNIDRTHKWGFDLYDNLIYLYYDNNGDGVGENIQTSKFDASGNLLFSAYIFESSKRYVYYSYSTSDKVLLVEYDNDGDSTIDQNAAYRYDTNDSLIAIEMDTDLDGLTDSRTTYEYDTEGRLIKTEVDQNIDGNLEAYDYYTYDPSGNLLLWDSYLEEPAFRDKYVKVYYSYDDQNRVITQYRHDFNVSGFKNYYGDDGEIIKIEYDSDGDSLFDRKDTFYTLASSKCSILGNGLSHFIQVEIPHKGIWQFDLCGSSIANAMALSHAGSCDSNLFFANAGCQEGDALAQVTLDSGTYYWTISAQDDIAAGSYEQNVSLVKNLSVSSFFHTPFLVYPNPAFQHISSPLFTQGEVIIRDILGAEIMTVNDNTEKIEISNLPSGMYTITIQVAQEINIARFLKM